MILWHHCFRPSRRTLYHTANSMKTKYSPNRKGNQGQCRESLDYSVTQKQGVQKLMGTCQRFWLSRWQNYPGQKWDNQMSEIWYTIIVCIIASRFKWKKCEVKSNTRENDNRDMASTSCEPLSCNSVFYSALYTHKTHSTTKIKITAQQCILVALILPIFVCSFWPGAHNGPHLAS